MVSSPIVIGSGDDTIIYHLFGGIWYLREYYINTVVFAMSN